MLALFVPLIISSGGNSGSQAATLVIRAMALGEVTLRDWARIMRREIFSGLALGTILGGIGFMRIAVWSAFSNLYGPHWLLVALTVGLALVGIVMWGALAGSMLPLVLQLSILLLQRLADFFQLLFNALGSVVLRGLGIGPALTPGWRGLRFPGPEG